MGAVVAFDYAAWLILFPEFSSTGTIPVSGPQANNYFAQATMLQVNDGSGPVSSSTQQLSMLNWLTAHIAKLFATPAGASGPSGLVGRISQAAEGTVNVTSEWAAQVSDNEAFYITTNYGAFYWQMRKAFLTARYVRPRHRGGVVRGYGGLL